MDVRHRPPGGTRRPPPADVPERFKTETLALRGEKLAKQQFGRTDLAADGTVAAELTQWLGERELDVAVTTLANYRNAITTYVIPFLGGRQLYTLDRRAIDDLYLMARGGRDGGPLSAETVRHAAGKVIAVEDHHVDHRVFIGWNSSRRICLVHGLPKV